MENIRFLAPTTRRRLRRQERAQEKKDSYASIVELNTIVQDLLLLLTPIGADGTRIDCALAESPLYVSMNERELYRAVHHLLLYAISAVSPSQEHPSRQGIIHVLSGSSNAGVKEIFLEISDNGISLPDDVKNALSSNLPVDRETKKSQLVFPLVKRIIEMNCGRLHVASPRPDIGCGTLFRVELPQAPLTDAP